MRNPLPLLLLCLTCQHAVGKSADKSAERSGSSKTDKRALAEGNSGLNKRAPLLGSPGIEYADTTESLQDKSPPQQQVYANPVPQVSKISDVLTGHGPSFPTAIANHLYSPLQVYQPLAKVDSSTTYEVSAPVPSQLAYSEHKIFYPEPSVPQANSIQYYNQPQKIFVQSPTIYPQQPLNFARATALSYAPQQQVQYNQQPLFSHPQYNQVPQQVITYPQVQPGYFQPHYQPGVTYTQSEQSSPSNTRPQTFIQTQTPQNSGITFAQSQPFSTQPGITYVQGFSPAPQQFANSQVIYTAPGVINKPLQRDLSAQPINVIDKNSDVDNQAIENEVKTQGGAKGGAVSYASFSQSTANQASAVQSAYLPSATKTFSVIPKAPSSNTNYIPSVAKVPTAAGYVTIGQPNGQAIVQPGAGYYPKPNVYHSGPQQVFQAPLYQVPQHGYAQQNIAAVSPTFPAIQYFGKFAQSLFGAYAQ